MIKKCFLLYVLFALGAQANDFAFKLYDQLSETEGNLFFSPASIEAALSMTAEGAHGETLDQFIQTLGNPDGFFPNIGNSVTLEGANAVWVDKKFPILGTFEKAVTEKHGAEVRAADFIGQPEVERTAINSWVEQKTRDKIQDLMPAGSIDGMTRLVLVNAIYFKGDWLNAFEPAKTTDEPFQTLENGSVDVPMMTMKPERLPYLSKNSFQCLELPYQGEDVSMLLILPKGTNGLARVEKHFSSAQLTTVTSEMHKTEVEVHLPRFKAESTFDLKQALTALGLTDAFDPQRADFSGISGTKDLFIGAAVHKAFVEVNEEGTEAAAATGIGIGVTSMPMPPTVFRVDRPFIFLIRENASGKILFMGRICDPSK